MSSGTIWKDEHDEMLKSCFLDSMSFAESAAAINEKFGTSYSRNSAIGRAHRLGLKSNNPAHERSPRQRLAPRQPRIAKPRIPKLHVFELDTSGLRCSAIEPLNVSLTDLERHQCRWPYGEGPYLFCGHPKIEESSYCEAHQMLSLRNDNRGWGSTTVHLAAVRRSTSPTIRSLAREYNGEEAT